MYITGKWELQWHRRNWRDVIVMPDFHKKGLNYQRPFENGDSLGRVSVTHTMNVDTTDAGLHGHDREEDQTVSDRSH